MRVQVDIEGHQMHRQVTGDVLAWAMTAELFSGQYLQVPCVVLKRDDGVIESVSLKTSLSFARVREVLE